MSVYVDELLPHGQSATWRYRENCHMCADTEGELDAMADRIDLKRAWKQIDKRGGLSHYDLTGSKRRLAVRHGAIEISWREFGARFMASRKAAASSITGQVEPER